MPSLSHTQMEYWGQCPRKWALLYVDQVPAAPNEYFVLGRAIHAAFEADGRRRLAGLPALAPIGLEEVFREQLAQEEALKDPLDLLADRVEALTRRGRAVLEAYVSSVQHVLLPLAVEEMFRVPVPEVPPEFMHEGSWEFTGIIDARTRPSSGSTIVDYKTALKPWTPGREHHSTQATAYLWAEWQAARQPLSTRVTFIVFVSQGTTTTEPACHVNIRPTSRSVAQLTEFTTTIHRVVAEISSAKRRGAYPARPSPLCGWCTVLGHCPVGQQWLAKHGRSASIPVLRPEGSTAMVSIAGNVADVPNGTS